MKELLQKYFLSIILIIVLSLTLTLTYEIITDRFYSYSKPEIVYPKDLDVKGIEYDHNNVSVVFWKLPGSIQGFGKKNGGMPIRLTEWNMQSQCIVYETENQTDFIERASKDPRVRYINPVYIGHLVPANVTVGLPSMNELSNLSAGKPEIVYPADLDEKGVEYDHNIVTIGFWKLPGSLERFGDKYDGKVYRLTEENLHLQSIEYETNNQTDFIDRASKDPLVKYIHPVGIGHFTPVNGTYGLPSIDNISADSTG
ncbi:hypothetical protein [Methanocella arvoryzae]|nr:hypothetical protein [Methanocella arvoryzae]